GVGIYEANQVSRLREQNRTLQQSQVQADAHTDRRVSDEAGLSNQLAALALENGRLRSNSADIFKLRGEVARLRADTQLSNQVKNDPDVQKALARKAKETRLRALLEQMPQQNIPELKLLGDRTYADVAEEADLDSESGVRAAFSQLRFAA